MTDTTPTRIYLTGRVSIENQNGLIEASAFPGRQGRLAFVRLAASRRRIEREDLANTLWHDELPSGWEGSLSAVMSKLKRTLTDAGLGNALESADGCYQMRLGTGVWVDLQTAINSLDRAEGALRHELVSEAWSHATVASAIFRRRFLPGEFGAWIDSKRRELHDFEVRTYDALTRVWLMKGDPSSAIRSARTSIELAPFRESGYALLMESHLAAGNRAESIRVFEEVRTLLSETMGIEPTEKVQELYERSLR